MRQKKFTLDLQEIAIDKHDNKGGRDVGPHVFSTASLLDGSWYNRTFWMYSTRWPGFQLANQSPKAGQILVVDHNTTYALRVFYHRNRHSPFFFPGTQGYLVFADRNTTEPQLVGEKGSRPAISWLPEDDSSRRLNAAAFEKDKGTGYTRADPAIWTNWVTVRARGMVKAGDHLFVAGPPDVFDAERPFAALDGNTAAVLLGLSAENGETLFETELESPPVFDGLIAANECLYLSLENGSVACLSKR
jgi:hypothetical protein